MRVRRAAPTTNHARPWLRLLTVAATTACLVQPSLAWAGPEPMPSGPTVAEPPEAEPPVAAPDAAPPGSSTTPTSEQTPPLADPSPAEPATPEPVVAEPPKAQPPAARVPDPPGAAEPTEDEPVAEPARDRLPDRLPTLQRAGWWTLFGGFVVGTTAGVLAGLSEREEDAAARLASRRDPETNGWLLYDDIADDYETALRRGRAYQRAAIGLAAVTGGLVIASATLFIVDAVRGRRSQPTQAGLRLGGTGLEVRF